MATLHRRARFTSPRRGEVDLLWRAIARLSKSGDGPQLHLETVTPHPALRADLSRWDRWTFDAAVSQSTLGKF
jgi:hypothetical protein